MDSLPKHMIHLGDGLFTLVNSFLKETRVHIRVYSTEDKAREDPDAVSVIKKNVCIFNYTVDSEMCVSIQRLFQRKDSGFQLVPERILLKGEQITHLYTSYTRIFDQKAKKPPFKVGDMVRISKWKGRFEKGYENNWSREIFTVHNILPRIPTVYKLRDFHNKVIEGTFYEKEIQKVVDSGYFPVEKVVKKRKRKGKLEYFVKFQGDPDEFNAWVFTLMLLKELRKSSFKADPQVAFPVFYVYSDIVQPVVVDHVEAPLLRVVRISGKDGEVGNAHYDRPQYVPVIRQSFQTIEIELRLNSGALVPFERGKVIIVLHFQMQQIL
ncbi:hypothetical protein AVEN_102932-1 [Araneus ventricosus]|uniref:Chromo domain-containing protein n=1 Tax=Araneus ventricosus TaxID=182803 RepID=A0A4Y2WBK4_ARAVE|nr:hypothetical protein AVEN_102932-1 [Araneus ventricosus]